MLHRPRAKCLFMSGYTADAIAHHGILKPNFSFIAKALTAEVLACKVRERLDSSDTWGVAAHVESKVTDSGRRVDCCRVDSNWPDPEMTGRRPPSTTH